MIKFGSGGYVVVVVDDIVVAVLTGDRGRYFSPFSFSVMRTVWASSSSG